MIPHKKVSLCNRKMYRGANALFIHQALQAMEMAASATVTASLAELCGPGERCVEHDLLLAA